MVYELGTITLGRFIEVYMGDVMKAVDGDEPREVAEAAAECMCMEYVGIVGGRGVASLLVRRNDVLKIQMRGVCFHAAERLLSEGYADDARAVLGAMGVSVSGGADAVRDKIAGLRRMDEYRMRRMEVSEEGRKDAVMDRDFFTRERVAVMGHLKMHIDEWVFKAKEYAYLVRQVSDEVERIGRRVKELRG